MATPDPRDPDHHARPASHEAVGDPEELPELEVEPEGTPPPFPRHTGRADQDIEDTIRQGDSRRAIGMLMERYGDRVYRYAVMLLRDDCLAEEVRQQVFIEAYVDINSFAFSGSIVGWLFAIARNRVVDAGRRRRRANAVFSQEQPAHEPAYHTNIDKRLALARLLEHCLGKLDAAVCEALLLHHQQGLTYEEVAEIIGGLANTIQQRVHRVLPALRGCIELQLGGKWI